MKKVLKLLQNYGIGIGFFLFCIYLAVATSGIFIGMNNLLNVARQISINTIIAVGMTFVILTAGIDLSVGSILALVGVLTASFVVQGYGLPLGICGGLGLGSLLGAFNGLLITKFRITPFISTLGMMTIARGLAFVYTKGRPIAPLPSNFKEIGGGYLGPIPIPVLIMLFVVLIAYLILTQTKFGRYVYAIGGNEEAAKLSGINVMKVKLLVYTISGFLAGLAGIILASRLGSGDPKSGIMYELNAIAAVVLGGTSLMGGIGSVLGTFLGALIIGVLDNGLLLLQVSSYNQMVAKGIVILVAVLLDQLKKR